MRWLRRAVNWIVYAMEQKEVVLALIVAASVFLLGVVSALLDWCWYPVC
jgi:hypothetical protein